MNRWYAGGNGFFRTDKNKLIDILFITSDTCTNAHITGVLEASAEYIVKISRTIDLGFFGKKQWGIGNSLTTKLAYYVNGQETQTAKITSDRSGWNFGISLRYIMHMGYDFEKMNYSFKAKK